MSNQVYANGMEVACKAAAGKSIAAFPDVCLSPPSPPAGPLPVPYPVTGYASDTSSGSKTVQISGKEVILKNQSFFSKCTGDEAATKSLGMGVVTHQISGKVYFQAWSMDVKVEGMNATRHLDITTHNHMSMPGDTPTWPYIDEAGLKKGDPCKKERDREKKACKNYAPRKEGGPDPCPNLAKPEPPPFADCVPGLNQEDIERLTNNVIIPTLKVKEGARLSEDRIKELKKKYKETPKYEEYKGKMDQHYADMEKATAGNDCLRARRCMLVPFKPDKRAGQTGCCPGQTGHHLIEASSFFTKGRGDTEGARRLPGCAGYDTGKAPCICVEGNSQNIGSHGLMHSVQSYMANKKGSGGKQSFMQASNTATAAVSAVFPESVCDPACIRKQLFNYHKDACPDLDKDTQVKAVSTGDASEEAYEEGGKLAEEKFRQLKESGALDRALAAA
ncbi:MAG: DUF4150 domain-containing protein [Planctomycetes bacterium]|nr:DUF4150 domain-containing protein [Planctomycetota bacterium]